MSNLSNEINSIKSEINKIKAELTKLKKKLKKNEIINNAQNLKDFKIKTVDQWNRLENSINKTGLFFEFEIYKMLNDLDLDFLLLLLNSTFKYPSQKNRYYTDYYFSEHVYPNIQPKNSMEISEYESDIVVWDRDSVFIDDLEFSYNIHYIIECKSRFNPPINYFIIPINISLKLNGNKIDNYLMFNSTIFSNGLSLSLKNFKMTDKKIIKISYPDMQIDNQDNTKKLFYQIYNRVDYECNKTPFLYFFMRLQIFNEKDVQELPKSIELPYSFHDFNQYYTQMKNKNLIPELFLKKFSDLFKYYIPIVVLNGNIYSMDLEQEPKNLKNKCNEISGFFLKYKDNEKTDSPNRSYRNLIILFMDLMNQYSIINLNDRFQYDLMHSVSLNMIFTTKDSFQTTFLEIKQIFKREFEENLNKLIKEDPMFLENLIRFQVFIWILYKNEDWQKQFISELHKEYIKCRNLSKDIF